MSRQLRRSQTCREKKHKDTLYPNVNEFSCYFEERSVCCEVKCARLGPLLLSVCLCVFTEQEEQEADWLLRRVEPAVVETHSETREETRWCHGPDVKKARKQGGRWRFCYSGPVSIRSLSTPSHSVMDWTPLTQLNEAPFFKAAVGRMDWSKCDYKKVIL